MLLEMKSTAPTPQFRLVRCPKCRLLLPEVPNVPVYRCGGCDALLQAKNRKKDPVTDVALMNESDHISEDKEPPSSLDHEAMAISGCFADRNNPQDQNGYGGSKVEERGANDLSDESQNSGSSHFACGDCDMKKPGVAGEVYSSTELVDDETEEPLPSAGPNSDAQAIDESPPLFAGTKSEEARNARGSAFGISNIDNVLAKGGVSSAVAVDGPFRERTTLAAVSSPSEQSHKTVQQGFDSMRSRDTYATTDYASPSSELSGILTDMSKSPTTKGCHAYDGSVSSYDGIEDQFSDRYIHSLEITDKADDFAVSGEKLRRDRFLVDSMRNIDPEMQHQPSQWLPAPSGNKKLYTTKEKEWDCDELGEPTRYPRPPRNSTRVEKNEFPPKVPLYRRSFQAGYGSSSFSSQVREDYISDSNFYSSTKLEYHEQEKMRLLRMIHELQDQLDQSCNLEENANGRVSVGVTRKEKNIPTIYNHTVPVEETWREPMYPMYPGRSRLGSNSAQQPKYSRMSFSGEAPNSRHHIDRHCLHCRPQDWQFSAPLPPALCHNQGLCGVRPGHNCYNSYSSSTSSPQRYMEPEFSVRGHETKSDDQRFKDRVMRKYLREKHPVVKRHFRPKAGGAPFITCYRCSKLLQLPEDFLLFKRRYYKLRCGACSNILKFSVQNRTHIIPYSPNAVDPPPSEVDDYSGVIDRRSISSSCRGNNCPHVDPMSYSDLSFCKSCSTEGDPVSLTRMRATQDNTDDRKMSYANSLDSMGKKKESIRKQFRNKYKDPVEAYGSAGPSFGTSKKEKLSSEIEVLQPRSSSPLHRLMGYASPSIVIRGTGLSAVGTSS